MKVIIHVMFVFGLVFFLCFSSVQAEVLYNIIDLGGITDSALTRATSINNKGQIVGYAKYSHGRAAVIFDPTGQGNNILLGTLGGNESRANSINNNGEIVGYAWDIQGQRATLFDPTGLGDNINLGSGSAWCINDNRQIVGDAGSANAMLFDVTGQGNNIYLGQGIGENIGSLAYCINNSGQIVGYEKYYTEERHAVIFDPSGQGNNIDLGVGVARHINEISQIVGYSDSHGISDNHAILFDATGEGNNVDLGLGEAWSINDTGQIVGAKHFSGLGWRAMLFDSTGNGNNVDLNTVITPSGWLLEEAYDINNHGWIVGGGLNPNGEYHAFLLIPEPLSLSLLALGGLALIKKRRE